ncbi:hypothetical protein ACIGW3_13650 [Streptomyces sp. NPDC053499]|uniref:hypothetical protein n=1 Tax=Streptomyces sp. NPDC053499 TaxID=3365707 RepID=UPI0037D7CE02
MVGVLSGCGKGDAGMGNPEYESRTEESAQDHTEEVSSRIRDLIDIAGKTTEPGALVDGFADCPGGDNTFRVRHAWSIYELPRAELRAGMDRLRERLPENGWKISKDGPDGSPNNNPEIVASRPEDGFFLKASLRLRPDGSSAPPLLAVTLVSPCYRNASDDD